MLCVIVDKLLLTLPRTTRTLHPHRRNNIIIIIIIIIPIIRLISILIITLVIFHVQCCCFLLLLLTYRSRLVLVIGSSVYAGLVLVALGGGYGGGFGVRIGFVVVIDNIIHIASNIITTIPSIIILIHLLHMYNFHLQLIISIILQLNLLLQLYHLTIQPLYL